MLPDFPDLKKKLADAANRHLSNYQVQASPIIRDIKQNRFFEGGNSSIKRPGETVEETEIKRFSAELMIKDNEMHQMTLGDILKRQEGIVDQLLAEQERHIFKTIHDSTEKTGNVVDGKGQGFSPEMLLEVFDKIEISFKGSGAPEMPTVVIHPSQAEAANRAQAQLFDDPVYRDRFIKMIERKRKEWFAREADRILVG
jgi:hypothetical protein